VQFNLKSRLEAAQDERRQRAAAVRHTTNDPADRFDPADPAVIDLRVIRSMRDAAEKAGIAAPTPTWNGSPRASVALALQQQAVRRDEPVPTTHPVQEPCPTCGGSVRLDMFDLVASVAHLTCLDCGLLFTARSPHA
jgi:hypothetical protein